MPSDIELSEFDFLLLMIIGYGLGVMSGLCFCAKYRNIFLTRSRSVDNLKGLNHHHLPEPVVIHASAPPATAPQNLPKITIE
jgi:hypothetical protein